MSRDELNRGLRKVESLLNEIRRVTAKGGLYLCISQSDKRAFYFEDHFGLLLSLLSHLLFLVSPPICGC